MEKIWTSDELLEKYIVEKIRRGYETSYTVEELADYLDFISYYVKTSLDKSTSRYDDVAQKYVVKESKKLSKAIDVLPSQLILPTYELRYQPKRTGKKKVEMDDTVSEDILEEGLTSYLQRNGIKRTIDTLEKIQPETHSFADRVTAALVWHIWGTKIANEIKAGRWPLQCDDISQFILETDLASIIKLSPMRDELIDFYTTICDRLQYVADGEQNFRMSNIEEEVLSKSNFDLVMDGYTGYYNTKDGLDRVDVRRLLNGVMHADHKFEEWMSLDNPKILKLSDDIKNARRKPRN